MSCCPEASSLNTVVPEPVPLAAALRVEVQDVVVDRPLLPVGMRPVDEFRLKRRSIETGLRRVGQRPVQRHALTSLDL